MEILSASIEKCLTGEIWKDIDNSNYQVSSFGRVRSFCSPRSAANRIENFIILKGSRDKDGYRRCVIIQKNGKRIYTKYYQLVCKYFIGPKPKDMVITHLDGNLVNDCVENLAYRTQKENINDKFVHNTMTLGEKNPKTNLKNSEVLIIKQMLAAKRPTKEIYKIFKLSISQLYSIKHNKTWKHIPWPNE